MNKDKIDKPLVSIIMNCRNAQAYLRQAIDSVFAQSYTNWEIVFLDNLSIDNSADIARSYGAKLRYFKTDSVLPLGHVRNLALEKAQGSYIAFLDCDDKWLADKLQKQVDLLERRKDIDFVYSNYFRLIMPEENHLILGLRGAQPQGDVFGKFLYNYPVNLQTVILRKNTLTKLNIKFDEGLEVSEDFAFFMKFLLKVKAYYIDEPLAVYRIHKEMNSQRLFHKYPQELEIILDKLKKSDSSIVEKYSSEINYYEAKLGYWYARALIEENNPKAARTRLAPYKFIDFKFLVLFFLTYLPVRFWRLIHRLKIENNFFWLS